MKYTFVILSIIVTIGSSTMFHVHLFKLIATNFELDKIKDDLLEYQQVCENLMKVLKHNFHSSADNKSYKQGINEYSDNTVDMLVSNGADSGKISMINSNNLASYNKLNSSIKSWAKDWRDFNGSNIVGPVLNQGGCGACVYFAAAAVAESAWAKKGHPISSLSPQQLNDCAKDPEKGNSGCEETGGTFIPTFNYIVKHGLNLLKNYPYLAKDSECNKDKEPHPDATINSWNKVLPHGDEQALLRIVDEKGPVAVAIHVDDSFVRYKQGIYDESCVGERNHALIVVGFGYDKEFDKDYWILKNQWGAGFGEQGYIRIRRNHGNMCDIAGDAIFVE